MRAFRKEVQIDFGQQLAEGINILCLLDASRPVNAENIG